MKYTKRGMNDVTAHNHVRLSFAGIIRRGRISMMPPYAGIILILRRIRMTHMIPWVPELPYIWTYRDRSLEKYSRFPVKLSKSGSDKSKRVVPWNRPARRVPGASGAP